jgi:hypothetical protein
MLNFPCYEKDVSGLNCGSEFNRQRLLNPPFKLWNRKPFLNRPCFTSGIAYAAIMTFENYIRHPVRQLKNFFFLFPISFKINPFDFTLFLVSDLSKLNPLN